MIEASIVLDSINPAGSRLVTMLARYPKFVHGEHTRHRAFSLSVSSSRAIPVSKNLKEAWEDNLRAVPVYWGAEQKGMSAGATLDDAHRNAAIGVWRGAAYDAVGRAKALQALGVHKSIVNRVIEPFLHVNVLVTGTTPGWLNFFGLRLDKAAQPEIRALAEAQWKCWNESKPTPLRPGEWHLPFVDEWDEDRIDRQSFHPHEVLDKLRRISTARCARLSYLSFETGKTSTLAEDLALYDRLIGSKPIHASPAEHQATPDTKVPGNGFTSEVWANPMLGGNLGSGWIQHRKLLPDEAVAALPEAYQ